MYNVQMVEKQLMKQDVVANADTLSGSIKDTGRVAVYGIYFDTNKADLKPASDPALAEIVKMLKADANLKVYVVGHTDNVGQFAHNVKLSQDRAALSGECPSEQPRHCSSPAHPIRLWSCCAGGFQ